MNQLWLNAGLDSASTNENRAVAGRAMPGEFQPIIGQTNCRQEPK
jgi:hypothetical protein